MSQHTPDTAYLFFNGENNTQIERYLGFTLTASAIICLPELRVPSLMWDRVLPLTQSSSSRPKTTEFAY